MVIKKIQAGGAKIAFDEQLDGIVSTQMRLLTALILFQLVKEDKTTVIFEIFFQYPFEKTEIDDLHKYGNITEYIYKRCFNDFSFLKINKFTLDSESILMEMLEKYCKTLFSSPQLATEITGYYSGVIEQYFELKKEAGFQKEYDSVNHKFHYKFNIEPPKGQRAMADLLDCAPKSIEISFIFEKALALEFESKIKQYLIGHYAKEDLAEFRDYIFGLEFVNGRVKIPFTAMENTKFNLIKTLKYLELTKEIQVRDWIGHDDHWNIKVLSERLLDLFKPVVFLSLEKDSLKPDLGIYFTEDENIKYNRKSYYGLTALEKTLCREIFTKEANFSFKTVEVEECIYPGHEVTKNRQDKLKKAVERLNKKIKTAFGIVEFIRYNTETIRRLV